MAKKIPSGDLENLPGCISRFIERVIEKKRYRKKVRRGIQAGLAGYFQNELKDCKGDERREQKARQLIAELDDAKLLATFLRRVKKRRRPLRRTIVVRGFQTIGVLILCLTLYVILFLSGEPNTVDQNVTVVKYSFTMEYDKNMQIQPR